VTTIRGRKLLKDDPRLAEKVKALGFMKLNVFEIVYAVLPQGGAWKAFSEDSLLNCPAMRDELDNHHAIYDDNLVQAYRVWKVAHSDLKAPTV
jgi:hypothetical protein